MALTSKHFTQPARDGRLDACAASDPGHIQLNAKGDHVARIQQALIATDAASIDATELSNKQYGSSTAAAVKAFKKNKARNILNFKGEFDDIVGVKTIAALDQEMRAKEGTPTPPSPAAQPFVCGPDVTKEIAEIWTTIQNEFATRTFSQQKQLCDAILFPIQKPGSPLFLPKSVEEFKQIAQQFASIDDWDVLPLFQGESTWLRSPPIFDIAKKGPCATPSSPKPTAPNNDDAHEDPSTCSNTVQVAGKCWLNGTVNYGTFGIMVKLCSDAKTRNPLIASSLALPVIGSLVSFAYSLDWAKTLIRAYKKFGGHPEDAALPIAWTEATFKGGPTGVPSVNDTRYDKCKCTCGCKGDVVSWDYVWEPVKTRIGAKAPVILKSSCP